MVEADDQAQKLNTHRTGKGSFSRLTSIYPKLDYGLIVVFYYGSSSRLETWLERRQTCYKHPNFYVKRGYAMGIGYRGPLSTLWQNLFKKFLNLIFCQWLSSFCYLLYAFLYMQSNIFSLNFWLLKNWVKILILSHKVLYLLSPDPSIHVLYSEKANINYYLS